MAVFRVKKTSDYTVMSNIHLKEKEMSLKAKGLMSVILSLPESWDYSVSGLVAICKEEESAINSTLKELKEFGYLRVDKLLPNETKSGRIEYIYNIFETPQKQEPKKQGVEKQGVENQGVEFQGVENQVQYNTNKLSTKLLSTYNNIECTHFKKPTLEEVEEYCNERQNNIDPQRFIDYYTANGWKVGRNSMKNWKAAVRVWEKTSGNRSVQAQKQARQEESVIDRTNRFLAMYEQGEN